MIFASQNGIADSNRSEMSDQTRRLAWHRQIGSDYIPKYEISQNSDWYCFRTADGGLTAGYPEVTPRILS